MSFKILQGDCLEVMKTMDSGSIDCCVTSPPYFGLRDYGIAGQLGLESTPEEYVAKMVEVFREVKRVLKEDGTLWLNLGDSYSCGGLGSGMEGEDGDKQRSNKGALLGPKKAPPGLKPKDLVGIPWRVAFALQADGWYLRQDLIWHKPNSMPESVTDRCTKAHEYIFLLAKNQRYYFDNEAIQEKAATEPHAPGWSNSMADRNDRQVDNESNFREWATNGMKNKRSVWTVNTQGYSGCHFATFPPKLIEPCILAGCPLDGTVLDPFNGAGTTGLVACRFQRNYIGIELNPAYCEMARKRIQNDQPLFACNS